MSQTGYNSYEIGRCSPNIDILKKLSVFYKVSIDYIVENEHCVKSSNLENEKAIRVLGYLDSYITFIFDLEDVSIKLIRGRISELVSELKNGLIK